MGLIYEEIHKLDCDYLAITDKLVSKNVRFNDSSSNHLAVYDNSGKKVFWINDEGCSIKAQNCATELDDVIGFPKIKDGLLYASGTNLDFLKNISLGNLDCSFIKVENLEVEHLAIQNMTLPSLSAISIKNNILSTDKITSNEANIKLINNDKLVAQDISSGNITTYSLNVVNFEPNDISSNNIKCEELQSAHAGISILETQQLLARELTIGEVGNIKLLNCQYGNVESLNCADASFVCLYANQIKLPTTYFGSLKEPLTLNAIDCSFLDCNNEMGVIRIYNKVVDSTPQNKIELVNIPEGDYSVETKCYNQFINVSYNLCKVDDKNYLFSKFNENPKDLVVEIVLMPN